MLLWIVGLMTGAALLSLGYLVLEREQKAQRERIACLSDSERNAERKRRAKRQNERLKLASTFCNGLGVAFVATSVLAPLASDRDLVPGRALLAVSIALILHATGQFLLHAWKSEE